VAEFLVSIRISIISWQEDSGIWIAGSEDDEMALGARPLERILSQFS
jgi:hypothetical protein